MKIQKSLLEVLNVEFHPLKPWVILVVFLLFLVLSSAPVAAITQEMGPDGQTEINSPISTLPLDQFSPVFAFPAGILMVIRTYFEDRMLQEELEGYKDYAREVNYRLFPMLW